MSPKTRKKKIYKNMTRKLLPKMTKQQITKILYPISLEQAISDFDNLKNVDCNSINDRSIVGSDFVNYFTAIERLNTKGRTKISFLDFCIHFKEYYNNKYFIQNGINVVFKGKFFKEKDKNKIIRNLKSFYNLYIGNVGIFRPILTKLIICKYKPKKMLDFTMGWGGRLVGACAENIESYIGIDLNTNLKPLYTKMVKTLNTLSTTKIKLLFMDSLKVDYCKLDYDFVFTSPPYYNIEIYNKNDVISKEEWNETFYKPIFAITYKYLKKGGKYCLNMPEYIYENVAKNVLGKCDEIISLGKHKRYQNKDAYSGNIHIFVWNK